MLGSL